MKADTAFRTISEVAQETGVAQHVLRYWETRFPQLRPLQRAGNRRYYRPADVALVRRIDTLLKQQGYTVKGVQKLLAEGVAEAPPPVASPPAPPPAEAPAMPARDEAMLAELRGIRDALAAALREDDPPH